MRILLVEDDAMLGMSIKKALELEFNVVDLVHDGESCEAALATTDTFDIIIMDIKLPGKSGLEVLRNIRSSSNPIPILLLTARDKISQKVEGLNLGADDYMIKPFDLEELIARITALARRSKGIIHSIITHRNLIMDTDAHKVTYNERKIELSPKEFTILKILMENIGRVISKSRLEEILYSWDDGVESNTVEVHIHYLRKKLDKNFLKTIRGVGYIIEK